MKKVLFFMLIFMGLMSSLYALDTVKIGCDIEKSQTFDIINDVTSVPSDIVIGQVYIWHKDTIHYSWGEGIDIKILRRSGGYKQDIKNDISPFYGKLIVPVWQVQSAGVTYAKSM